MYNISSRDDLEKAIRFLENEVGEQQQLLTVQFSAVYESFSPVGIIKNLFREVVTSEELRTNILTAAMGISTGYLTKKLLIRENNTAFKIIAGNLLQYGIANLIVNPSGSLRTILLPLLEFLGSKAEEQPEGT